MFRKFLRAAASDLVLRKRLPRDLGGARAYCSPGAMLSMLRPGWMGNQQALDLFRWVRRFVRPGMTVWDVGANQGLFALAAAFRTGPSGQVFAFEPDLLMAALLQRSVNCGLTNLSVLALALSDEHGFAKFGIAATDRALNHLVDVTGNPLTGGLQHVTTVPVVTGDWIASRLPAPAFIKIDVEGAEHRVLAGMQSLLERQRPRLIVEVAAENCDHVSDWARRLDYAFFDASAVRLERLQRLTWNNLLIPVEQLDQPLEVH